MNGGMSIGSTNLSKLKEFELREACADILSFVLIMNGGMSALALRVAQTL